MKKGYVERTYKRFAFSFLGFKIGANRFSKLFKTFLKCPLYSCKTGKCWNQHAYTNVQHFVKF